MAFVDDLKSRFIGSGPTPYDDITEEEFLQAQSRLLNPQGQTSKAKVCRTPVRLSTVFLYEAHEEKKEVTQVCLLITKTFRILLNDFPIKIPTISATKEIA